MRSEYADNYDIYTEGVHWTTEDVTNDAVEVDASMPDATNGAPDGASGHQTAIPAVAITTIADASPGQTNATGQTEYHNIASSPNHLSPDNASSKVR